MQMRSYDDLSEYLREDLRWRVDELDGIRLAVNVATAEPQKRGLVRGGVALLYAHWEGFIKGAATAYLDYVAFQVKTRKARLSDLAPPFLGLALAEMCPVDQTQRIWFTNAEIGQFLRVAQAGRASIKTVGVVDTGSNLTYRVLERIMRTLGLDPSPYELKRHYIDRSLVDARNNIAHGEYYIVRKEDFTDLRDEIIPLMRGFNTLVENAAAQHSHALPTARPALS